MPLREYDQIPLYIVEDHNEALNFILRGIGSKHLSFNGNLLIHFDSHPDLLLSEDLKPDDVFSKENLLTKVSIETWILPLVFAEHVSTILWIKPEWSNQIDEGTYTIYIGGTKENEIKVFSSLFYFVSALNYAPYEKLINPRKVTLHVVTLEKSKESVAKCAQKLLGVAKHHGNNLLLDIDLDFFATMNPFIDMYSEAKMYDRLRIIYKYEDIEIKNKSFEEAELKRKLQINNFKNIFKVLEEMKCLEDRVNKVEEVISHIQESHIYSALKDLILDLCKIYGDDVDWEMIHNAGTTIDEPKRELPHHLSTEEEIQTYINLFQILLKDLPKPKIITMARSSFDDYCPAKIVNLIQKNTCAVLNKLFNPNIEKNYEEI